jgi:signal transduction histidine kinase
VSLALTEGGLLLAVRDNGIGFDTNAAQSRPSLGRANMRERVRLLGGTFQIKSTCREGHDRIGMGAAQSRRVMTRPRVLLADDHRMVAEALKSMLEQEFELLAVVG